jgi:predicted transcriptional regulator
MTKSEIKSFIHGAIPELADWQIKAIDESEKQIEAGLTISREEADKKAEEWLKSKNEF